MTKQYLDKTGLTYFWGKLKNKFQDKLVSGTNIKTVNNQSLLGSGDITISGGGGTWGTISGTLSDQTDLQNALDAKQDKLTLPLKYEEYIEDEEDYSCYYNYVINTESVPGTGIPSGVYEVDTSICTQPYPEGILLVFGHGSGNNNQYMYTLKQSDILIIKHASDASYSVGDAITVISSDGSFITTKVKSVSSSGITTLEKITLENKEAVHHITSDLNQNRLMFVQDINICDVAITQECYIDSGAAQNYTFPAGTLCFCKYGNVSSNKPGLIITPTGDVFKVTALATLTITMSTIKPYVDLTSNQTIGGVKTFSSVPVCATQPTSNNELANKAYVDAQAAGGDTVPVGLISAYPASTAPHGWLLCDGSAVSRTTYKELFDIIGTSHGQGDGSTTFNLPYMPSYTIVGVDANDTKFNAAGKTYGEKTHTLTVDEMPSHSHGVTVKAHWGNAGNTSAENYNIGTKTDTNWNNRSWMNYASNTGGGQAHNNIQPSIAEYYMIKAFKVSVPGNDLGDTLPIGTVLDYDGDTVPDGYEEVADYSTSEVFTGKLWIDGKKIYRKVVNFGTLPNTGGKNVNHNISNIETITNYYGLAYRQNDNVWMHIDMPRQSSYLTIGSWVTTTQISIETGTDRTNMTAIVVIEYTKTTN